jgi:hypothetical protein
MLHPLHLPQNLLQPAFSLSPPISINLFNAFFYG